MGKIKLEELKYMGLEGSDSSENVEELNISQSEVTTEENTDVAVEEQIEEESETAENITLAATEIVENAIVNVYKLAIYPHPSTANPARLFTGNVEVVGHIDQFTIVKYVKSGFGLVKGYTLGL